MKIFPAQKIQMAGVLLASGLAFSQSVSQKLDAAVSKLMATPAAASANISVFVSDENGAPVYEKNPNTGLSTASTQKIFTAACAMESLGKAYQYTTTASYTGTISEGKLSGDLVITSNGDPTLGSWRYEGYKPEDFKKKLMLAIQEAGIRGISGKIIIDDSAFDMQTIPGGWPWNDLGNYYGAGVWGINWRENQFDVRMEGSKIKSFNVELPGLRWANEVQTGGSTDQSQIYTAPHSEAALIAGTLPAKGITVSGAMPNPPLTLGNEVKNWLGEAGISVTGISTYSEEVLNSGKAFKIDKGKQFFTWKSPTLDKIVYYFLRKSVNFYGETLIKTLAKEKRGGGSFAGGVDFLKDFWSARGIPSSMINFADGSGLSPQNYVSSKAEVLALLYSSKQKWFGDFYEGFPTMENGMKMKSGTMKNTKSFAGFHTSAVGKKYVFSIIINNYQASDASAALQKILNNLK